VLIHSNTYRFDLTCAFVYHLVQSIQEKVTSDRANDCFSLEVLVPIEGVSLSIGTWDSSSPPRVSDEVVRPRELSDEHNMIRLYNVLCHPRWKEKLHGKLWRSSSRLFWHSLICTTNASFIVFLCFPLPFVNLGMRFLLRGEGYNIPCYRNPN
jgi:hypothetical protein